MDIKSIMDDGLKINANCSFETFRLHEDGFDRDAHANRTLLNIEFTREYFDEETDDYIEKTVASMIFYIFKYREFDMIEKIADITGHDNMMGVDIALKYYEMCKKDPNKNAMYDYICSGGDLNICYLHEFYIDTEYRGLGFSEYFLCMIPTIIGEYMGIDFGFVSTHIRPYEYQGKREGNALSDVEYDDNNPELMKIMEKPLLKVGFVQIGEGNDFATDLPRLYHKGIELNYETEFTGRYYEFND